MYIYTRFVLVSKDTRVELQITRKMFKNNFNATKFTNMKEVLSLLRIFIFFFEN